MFNTGSCGPSSARIAARCVKLAAHDTLLAASFTTCSVSQWGNTPYPSLQPVIA